MAESAPEPSSSSSTACNKTKPKPWGREDIPDLTGKIAIVSGGTAGIGYETALGLATAGAQVFILGRNEERGKQAVELLKTAHPSANVSFLQADLGSLVSITEFAKNFNGKGLALDILVNNAGIMGPPTRQTTVDGFELVMGTNHLGTFAITGQLLPSLKRSSSPRVVTLSSALAKNSTRIDFDDFQTERKKYGGHSLYCESKLANIIFTLELQRRSDANGWGIAAIAVHPGLVKTDMTSQRETLRQKLVGLILIPLIGQEVTVGAHPSLFAATSPSVKGGEYYGPGGLFGAKGPVTKVEPPTPAKDLTSGEKLWQISEELTKVSYN